MYLKSINAAAQALIRATLIGCISALLCACIAVPQLPDTEIQAQRLAQQPFSPAYRLAISSYYENTQVLVDVSRQFVRFEPPRSDAERMRLTLAEQGDRDDLERAYSASARIYNNSSAVSGIEQSFADQLQAEFSVSPVFLPRKQIQARLDNEWPPTSAMMHAKQMAAEAAYDGVLVVYFEPLVVEADTGVGPFKDYRLSYRAKVAMRAVKQDQLLYFHDATYPCTSKNLMSTERRDRAEDRDTMAQCEREIHDLMVQDFIDFTRQAREAGSAVSG